MNKINKLFYWPNFSQKLNFFLFSSTPSPTRQRFVPARAKDKENEESNFSFPLEEKAGDFDPRPSSMRKGKNWNVVNDRFTTLGYSSKRAEETDQLYLIEIEKDGIRLKKIGRTFYDLKKRFKEEDVKPIGIHKIWKDTHQVIYNIEQSVLKAFEKYKYAGKPFRGNTECFELTLPVDRVKHFIENKLGEKNEAKCVIASKKSFATVSTEQLHIPLLDIPVFTNFIMKLDKMNFSKEAFTLLRRFYSFSIGIIFLSILAHAAEENNINKENIKDRQSYRRVTSRLIGRAHMIQAFYAHQDEVQNALEKGASKKELHELWEKIRFTEANVQLQSQKTQQIAGKARTLPIWHPNKLLPQVDPRTINIDKAFELTTNALLTPENNQFTREYIENNFGITTDIVIKDCSDLLNRTAFWDDFDCVLLAQELNCC